ncbi:unnamed protein product [Chondrus crispus]|uniref:Uncharacterized protein n=1 Tax=Chondrus crispus TaxID=2769 RepID=R7Q4X9_CHOCR|nr:unnamed protein product [Chondrus crispus]XP_005712881.1 unnamed protein product [Chondrus crispus]CDF32490.1 unnamed protein product [Chondrus crispus]CDF33078.1 unnamed protein product [Chondrus crispus]|eukprot:XP_005712155.1 unnamed protein product [Chondrus crispus]
MNIQKHENPRVHFIEAEMRTRKEPSTTTEAIHTTLPQIRTLKPPYAALFLIQK